MFKNVTFIELTLQLSKGKKARHTGGFGANFQNRKTEDETD